MQSSRSATRRGSILLCVMTCLMIATSMVAVTIHMALRARREGRLNQQLLQTEFLVDAGLLRARERLAAAPEYVGEVWAPAVWPGPADGELFQAAAAITIEVEAPADPADATSQTRQVTVTARLGGEGTLLQATQRSQSIQVTIPPTSSAE